MIIGPFPLGNRQLQLLTSDEPETSKSLNDEPLWRACVIDAAGKVYGSVGFLYSTPSVSLADFIKHWLSVHVGMKTVEANWSEIYGLFSQLDAAQESLMREQT